MAKYSVSERTAKAVEVYEKACTLYTEIWNLMNELGASTKELEEDNLQTICAALIVESIKENVSTHQTEI